MAENGSNNWLWWSIGGVATLGLGLGIYYFVKANKEAKAEEQKNNSTSNSGTQTTYTPPVYNPTSSNTSTPPAPAPAPSYTPKSTPFTSVEQSNAFRTWVNAKDPTFAREIDLDASASSASSMNNSTIQKAWGKYSEAYYTANSLALNGAKFVTGSKAIEGGIKWTSVDAVPRGEIVMYTDGKITANAVNSQGGQTKFVQGGWYISGLTFNLMIGGANYSVGAFSLKDAFWSILKKAGIYNSSSNNYSAFNANMGDTKFGLVTDGTKLQDVML
jgi:hypothetical protein